MPIDWAAWLPVSLREPLSTLKKDRVSWVRVLAAPAGLGRGDVVVKCRVDRGLSAWIKRLFRASRGDRQWRGAVWLKRHGLRTARPLALMRAVIEHEPCELLVMERLLGKSVLEHLAAGDLSIKQQHAVAREVGRLIAKLYSLDRYNRDGKPSNLMVVPDGTGGLGVATIDTVAIRWSGGDGDVVPEMLASLYIEPVGCGVRPGLSLCARAIRSVGEELGRVDCTPQIARRYVRWLWSRANAEVRTHGDPVPKVNPLGDRATIRKPL